MRVIDLGDYKVVINSPSPLLPERRKEEVGSQPSTETNKVDEKVNQSADGFSTSVEVKHH